MLVTSAHCLKIHEEFLNRKYTLREFEYNKEKKDISLNRCSFESIGFLPEKFKIGFPTPGKPNDCSGPYFILEDNILTAIQPVLTHSVCEDDYDDLNGASCSKEPDCTSSIDQSDYSQISIQGIEDAIHSAELDSTSNACTPLLLYPDGGNVAETIDRENTRKRHISLDADYSENLEWETTKYFRLINIIFDFILLLD